MISLLCLVVQGAMAGNDMEESYRWQIILNGIKSVSITFPIYDEGGLDGWVDDGKLYITPEGGTKQTVLYFHSEHKNSDECKVYYRRDVGGTMILNRDNNYGSAVIWPSQNSSCLPRRSGTNLFYMNIVWDVPSEFRGKKCTFSWDVHKKGQGTAKDRKFYPNDTQIEFTKAPETISPMVMQPILGYDEAHTGQMMVIYTLAASSITKMTAHYKEKVGSQFEDRTMSLSKEANDFIYLPADRCYKEFYIDAVYHDAENTTQNTQSVAVDLPTLHIPYNLIARTKPTGEVELQWDCRDKEWQDISMDDFWDIQRNVTGDDEDESAWLSIGQIDYTGASDVYTFTDNTLLNIYQGKPVSYRVRRSSTSTWEWLPHTYTQVWLPSIMRLPPVTHVGVKKGIWNQERREVEVGFNLISTTQFDMDGNFILNTADDWETLAKIVAESTSDINVLMTADIYLGESQTMLGATKPFRGTFNGNGHKLTVNYDGSAEYMAPFTKVGRATISDLTVAGTIKSSRKFASGLIGLAEGASTDQFQIERCQVTATMDLSINGDATASGFIGLASVGSVSFTDCIFNGRMLGTSAHSIGGFVGWKKGLIQTTLTNCVFAPTEMTIKMDNMQAFVRYNTSGVGITLNNCYYVFPNDANATPEQGTSAKNMTPADLAQKLGANWQATSTGVQLKDKAQESDFILRTAADWEALAQKVEEGTGNVDVIMAADIDLGESQTMLGVTKPYQGTFNGNGHTLTVHYNENAEYVAPFMRAGHATITDLTVAGTIKTSQKYAGGLVGLCEGTNTDQFQFQRCRVTATMELNINGDATAGGFIGLASVGDVTFTDCIFDGRLTGSSAHSIGGFVGWKKEAISMKLYNGVFAPYEMSTKRDNMQAFVRCHTGGTTPSYDNCYYIYPDDSDEPTGQGSSAKKMDPTSLAEALGDSNWRAIGNGVQPQAQTLEGEYGWNVWDEDARLVLYINKSVDGEVRYTERRELTNEEVKKGWFKHQLTTSCVDHSFRMVVERSTSLLQPCDTIGTQAVSKPQGETFRFDNNVKIDSLVATTQQASVLLEWYVTGEGDYYRISRRDTVTNKEEVLEEACNNNVYVDKTVQPQHVYLYTVEGVNNCEGRHVSTASVIGSCRTTGMVCGYIRLKDGTAQGGVTVKATPTTETLEQGGKERSTVTDASGYFEIDSLVYQKSGSYIISVVSTGDEDTYGSFTANFTENTNLATNVVLTLDEYILFKGLVMYEGTSVPVIGASFEVDGTLLHNGAGKPIKTNSQGIFSISLPRGQHTVRCVKDGHTFLYDGFFTDSLAENPKLHNWQKSISEHVFWDQTRVMLRGRVVGGDTQGSKPLGQRASRNNLGDSITIVMQLEGDNASWLVRDQLNDGIKERHQDHYFGSGKGDTCHIDIYRHRLLIKPSDSTAEYCVPMLPVKYKVTEIYAEGYTTLFQTGKVGETLDLSACVEGDTATYSRIYHSEPTLAVRQFNMSNENYMGIKKYTEIDNAGNNRIIELWNDSTGYSFGYPVFMAGSSCIFMLTAEEQYYWNNKKTLASPDVVHLNGGEVHIQNALVGTDMTETVVLDSLGEAVYSFVPQNLTFTQEGDMALKPVTMTLLYDNTYYDIDPMNGKPIQGYVLASKTKDQGKLAVADGGTFLIDILRDPPGAGSSASIESGTKLNYSFSQNLKSAAGVKLDIGKSTGDSKFFNGTFAGSGAGSFMGEQTDISQKSLVNTAVILTYYNSWQYNYSFDTSETISTSSGNTNVGPDADVFIGMTQEAVFSEGIAVRAVCDSTYQQIKARQGGTFNDEAGSDFDVALGTMKLIAEGRNSKGEKVYIIRDEVLNMNTRLKSTFVHTAKYIEKELIPQLFKLRNDLLLSKDTDTLTAKKIADNQGFATYISLVDDNDPTFGLFDTYKQVDPTGRSCSDSVAFYNRNIETWIGFLATNEKEKLTAHDRVKTYAVDGRTSVSYTENFGITDAQTRYLQIPFVGTGLPGFSFTNMTKSGSGGTATGGTKQSTVEGSTKDSDNGVGVVVDLKLFNTGFYLKYTPVATLDYNYNYGETDGFTKKVSFTLQPSTNSNLVVDVLRTTQNVKELEEKIEAMKQAGYDEDELRSLFFQMTTEDYVSYVKHGDGYGIVGSLGGATSYAIGKDVTKYRSLVYRTKGGATSEPYEDERRTKYYEPGTVIDEKTVAIDNLRIWADQASMSNVPFDEPARFVIHMANESEMPAMAKATPFIYFLAPNTNPKGAKLTIDGNPVTTDGVGLVLTPGVVEDKVLEMTPGADFDYENIVIGVVDPNDLNRAATLKLSAHFVPTAGKVNISLPGDKWVVNTESPYSAERDMYYMPVRIDGFDVNYRNFDHIELQYKLSTQGDKEWVNVCSYYNDSTLMAKATGECRLIGDGPIMATFWGEEDPVEQQYDLRAVNYCRYGNGFLTRSSNILTGVKDTRRPQLFGTPKPEDGILDIGDDITLRFSEPIAGNYLRNLNNFQVLGQTRSSNISLATCLRFNGYQEAVSKASRNLGGKAFTVEMMVNPDHNGRPMTLFCHGSQEQYIQLGVSEKHQLMAVINNQVYKTNDIIPFNGLRQIAFTFEPDIDARTTTITCYDGSKDLGSFTYNELYMGQGTYSLGYNWFVENEETMGNYEGDMLEFRLWNHALSVPEMNEYRQKVLTGYELGLLDNYPLSEGQGSYSYNRVATGGDLEVGEGTWKVPSGIAMKLDGQNGFRIKAQKLQRQDFHDYTMAFWFRTDDANGTLLSNGDATTEAGYYDHFNIGIDKGTLYFRWGGMQKSSGVDVNDGQWHHVAVSVTRSRNVGNLYVDKVLRNTFAVDTLGGILGDEMVAGATLVSPTEVTNAISGNIDELSFFEMALTENYIRAISSMAPTGEEMGLLAHLNFAANELQMDNSQLLTPSGVSRKRYWDATAGKYTSLRDSLVDDEVVRLLADRNNHAPIRGVAQLENIPYSFVSDGKDLLINLDVPDYQIEKTNIIVTVKEINDLNGNSMASPVTMDLFVYRMPLHWDSKQMELETQYGEVTTFNAHVMNLSGKNRKFRIEGLPVWITASATEGAVDALDQQTITFTMSPYINIGNYDEVVYIVTEDGMNEPLPISIKVRGTVPDWAVSDDLIKGNHTMHIVGRVTVNESSMTDPDDIITVVGNNHQVLGTAHIAEDGLAYLTVYNKDYSATALNYEYFDASTGDIWVLLGGSRVSTFQADSILGSPTEPVNFSANNCMVQTLYLKKGWNWISFFVNPGNAWTFGELMNSATMWEVGDGVEFPWHNGGYAQLVYKAVYNRYDPNHPFQVWDCADSTLVFDSKRMYRFYSMNDKVAYLKGFIADREPVTIHQGWNRVGFISQKNLPLGTALADYTDQAANGDIIKSQSEFAVLTVDANGNKMWRGTLQNMRAGEGYMLKRNAPDDVSFTYPDYYNSRYSGNARVLTTPLLTNVSATSMTVVAVADGIDIQEGDELTAWRGAVACGIAKADADGIFYLNIGDVTEGTTSSELSFTLERDDQLVAMATPNQLSYAPDAAFGTPSQPTAIRFNNSDRLDADGWYSIDGVKLQGKPRQKGVYIHHNEKVIIK